uniref:HAT C-terminal dimerisation domain-containing protein n=1 Tax=Lactuca sativa TaxID=4236 RepID=A0A9R1XP98_LACSA|nr:hypothetical protein LSAT_V11C200075000 [Lactuca sativa]
MELLSLSSTLVLKEHPKVINVDWICLLIFNIDATKNHKLSGISTIVDLCKVVQLILTLSVSTATTWKGFPVMKIFKNRLRNKMSDDFLANNFVVYIEREIVENIYSESVTDEFKDLKGRHTELQLLF